MGSSSKKRSQRLQTLWLVLIVAGFAWLAISQLKAAPSSLDRVLATDQPTTDLYRNSK